MGMGDRQEEDREWLDGKPKSKSLFLFYPRPASRVERIGERGYINEGGKRV